MQAAAVARVQKRRSISGEPNETEFALVSSYLSHNNKSFVRQIVCSQIDRSGGGREVEPGQAKKKNSGKLYYSVGSINVLILSK